MTHLRHWRTWAVGPRRRLPGSPPARTAVPYFALALVLTVVTIALHWLVAPPRGLTRTIYATTNFTGAPLRVDRTPDVSLAFLADDPELPRRSFSARWSGFWILSEALTFDLYAGADDRVDLFIDTEHVLTRNARVGMHTTRRRVTLGPGTHEIVVRYVQHGGGTGLNVQWALPGAEPAPLPAGELFAEPPDHLTVMVAAGTLGLLRVLAFVWAAALVAWGLSAAPPAFRRWRAVAAPRGVRSFAQRMTLVAAPALLSPLVLFLVGPHTIYDTNRSEFMVPITDLAGTWLLGATAAGWGGLLAIGCAVCLLSERAARIYSALLLACGLLFWAQGTLLVADYGPLYGERLNLGLHDWRTPYELALWIAVPVLAVAFAYPVSRIAPFASRVFILVQLAVVALSILTSPAAAGRDQAEWSEPPEPIYQLSRERNVFLIVLDGFLSELFGEAVNANREAFDRDFPGFVFYADHLGAFPTTRASVPAMMTGIPYRNDMPFRRFLRRTTGRRSIASVLADHGYAVRSISFHPGDHPRALPPDGPADVQYTIPTPYSSYSEYVRFTALQLFDLSLFRHVPQPLKSSVYDDEAWLVQRLYADRSLRGQQPRTVRPSNHAAFMEDFTRRLTVSDATPVYTFVHVALPHPPVVLDGDCAFIGQKRLTRARYAAQSRCALQVASRFLDRLRRLGIYDRSAVVLTADHGWRVQRRDHPLRDRTSPAGHLDLVALSAMPLLAIKPNDATGPLRVSMAPTALTDVPATVADLAGLPEGLFPGDSALRIDEHASRTRTYAFHSWRNADWRREYMDVLHLFSVEGPVLNPDSWTYETGVAEPAPRAASAR